MLAGDPIGWPAGERQAAGGADGARDTEVGDDRVVPDSRCFRA